MRLGSKVALVTGSAGEIGRAIAERLAQEGADVAVADIPDTRLQDSARAVNDLGRHTLVLSVDVTDTVQVGWCRFLARNRAQSHTPKAR